jgi:hypothetical protein
MPISRSMVAPKGQGAAISRILSGAAISGALVFCLLATVKDEVRAGTKAPSPQALSFNLKAQFEYRMEGEDAMPADALDAKVMAQGRQARLETSVGERPLVVLISPPYLYKLLPRSKTGTRYLLSKMSNNPGLSSLDPQPWLRDPGAIRENLKKQGAKRVGVTKMNGQAVEIWTATKFMGQNGQVKAFLRATDALPVRMEIKSKQLTATANWSNYQKIKALPSVRFQPPSGYRIREAED